MPLSVTGLGGGAASLNRHSGGVGIYQDIVSLVTTLDNISNPSSSNSTEIGNIQGLIESAYSTFNVFAVIGQSGYSESLNGTGAAGGNVSFTQKNFSYNTTSSNIISTGNDIVDMDGGSSSGISGASVIDGKKWMASAQFNGSYFDGILIWIFTGDSVNINGNVNTNNRPVTKVRDIFYPVGTGNDNYHHFYPIALSASGHSNTVYSNFVSGRNGWNFSNGSGAGTNGYNSTSVLSGDDGAWGYRIPTSTNTSYVDGNSPGASQFDTSSSTPGFGMGNYNAGDSNSTAYWNGTDYGSSNNLGFVFSGDA